MRCRIAATIAASIIVLTAVALGSVRLFSQSAPVVFEGARLIPGDGSAPIDGSVFVVQDGRITAVGRRGQLQLPPNAARVDLAGRTVMPALNNVHIHIGYEGFTSWSAENHSAANVLDHLRREAFYGVGAVMTMGDQPSEFALAFQRDQRAGKFEPAARFQFAAGMAPPGGGPDSLLIKGTTPLKAVYEISTPDQARAAVRQIGGLNIDQIKIWVDDRDAQRGSKQKMPVDVVQAIVEEAHARKILVHAHATTLANQKAVVRAGIDVLVHTVSNDRIDDEYVALLGTHKPYWAPVMGLLDTPEVCEPNNTFVEQSLPASTVADIRAGRNAFNLPGCDGAAASVARREGNLSYNFPRMLQGGARLVLATDAGVLPGYSFGWSEHHEMGMYARFGTPATEIVTAATSRAAEVLRLTDTGTIATGKRADFVVLQRDPLQDIRNTRTIESVYLSGAKLDREKIAAGWKSPTR